MILDDVISLGICKQRWVCRDKRYVDLFTFNVEMINCIPSSSGDCNHNSIPLLYAIKIQNISYGSPSLTSQNLLIVKIDLLHQLQIKTTVILTIFKDIVHFFRSYQIEESNHSEHSVYSTRNSHWSILYRWQICLYEVHCHLHTLEIVLIDHIQLNSSADLTDVLVKSRNIVVGSSKKSSTITWFFSLN